MSKEEIMFQGWRNFRNLIIVLAMAVPLAAMAGFSLFAAGCLYDDSLPLCRHPGGGWIVLLLATAAVLAPAAWVSIGRARYLAGRRGQARPVAPARVQSLEFVVRGLWPGNQAAEAGHPIEHFGETTEVAFKDGQFTEWKVVVDWGDFWQFVNDAWARQRRYEQGDVAEGPLSSRYWVQRIGRETWEVYLEMLRSSSALRGSPHKPLLRGAPWTVFEAVRARWC